MTENVIIISKIDGGYLITSPTKPYIRTDIGEAVALVRELINKPPFDDFSGENLIYCQNSTATITADEIDKLSKEG